MASIALYKTFHLATKKNYKCLFATIHFLYEKFKSIIIQIPDIGLPVTWLKTPQLQSRHSLSMDFMNHSCHTYSVKQLHKFN